MFNASSLFIFKFEMTNKNSIFDEKFKRRLPEDNSPIVFMEVSLNQFYIFGVFTEMN